MKKFNITSMALALSLVCSTAAMAEGISRDDYKAGKNQSAAQYKGEKAACKSFSGNARDVCVLEAKGREKVTLAELDLAFKPGVNGQYKLDLARADAAHAVAKERCDDKAGTAKDVCVEEAKAAWTTAKADAMARMKVDTANALAQAKTVDANRNAKATAAQARKDAAETSSDAQYELAKEKCDTYAGEAKDHCLSQARKNFGKS